MSYFEYMNHFQNIEKCFKKWVDGGTDKKFALEMDNHLFNFEKSIGAGIDQEHKKNESP